MTIGNRLRISERPWDEALNASRTESRRPGRYVEKGDDMDYDWKMQYEAYWDAAIDRLAMAAEQKARTEEVSRLKIALVETDSPRQDSLRTAGSKLNRGRTL
jgi:hypothetical protein